MRCETLMKNKIFSLFIVLMFILSSFISVNLDNNVVVGDEPRDPGDDKGLDEPYIYVAPNRMGAFGKYEINVPYYRNWLNNTVVWKVEKSTDGSHWSDYKKFTVNKDWNEKDITEKHTVIVDADDEAYYRIFTNTGFDYDLISYNDKSMSVEPTEKSNDYELQFKITDTKDYTLVYNWDDYLNSDTAGISTFSKEVKTDTTKDKQYFEWSIVSTVKIKKGEQFVLDPTYGTIPSAVTDSWEWDTEEGRIYSKTGVVKLGTSNYYAIAFAGDDGTSYDGHIRTTEINTD